MDDELGGKCKMLTGVVNRECDELRIDKFIVVAALTLC